MAGNGINNTAKNAAGTRFRIPQVYRRPGHPAKLPAETRKMWSAGSVAAASKKLRFYTTAGFSLLALFVLYPLIAAENRSSEEITLRICGAVMLMVIALWPLPQTPSYKQRR